MKKVLFLIVILSASVFAQTKDYTKYANQGLKQRINRDAASLP